MKNKFKVCWVVVLAIAFVAQSAMGTLVAVTGVSWPHADTGLNLYGNNPGSPYTSFLMDASGEKVAFVFRVPKTGNLSKVHFRTVACGTPEDLKVSFQDIDATTGNPDGTADQFDVVTGVAANTWTSTAIISDDGSDTGVKRAVTINAVLSIVIEPNSFSAMVCNIGGFAGGARNQVIGQSYITHFTAAWAKNNATVPNFALEYDDGSFAYIGGTLPYSAISTQAFNSGSTPDERALLIAIPFDAKSDGAWIATTAAADGDLVLYEDTTALVTITVDKDIFSGGGNVIPVFIPWGQEITLNAGTTYYLSWKPSGSSSTVVLVDVHTANAWNQMSGGAIVSYAQRTDAGAWSPTTTRRILAGLSLSALDDGAGGASGGTGRVISH